MFKIFIVLLLININSNNLYSSEKNKEIEKIENKIPISKKFIELMWIIIYQKSTSDLDNIQDKLNKIYKNSNLLSSVDHNLTTCNKDNLKKILLSNWDNKKEFLLLISKAVSYKKNLKDNEISILNFINKIMGFEFDYTLIEIFIKRLTYIIKITSNSSSDVNDITQLVRYILKNPYFLIDDITIKDKDKEIFKNIYDTHWTNILLPYFFEHCKNLFKSIDILEKFLVNLTDKDNYKFISKENNNMDIIEGLIKFVTDESQCLQKVFFKKKTAFKFQDKLISSLQNICNTVILECYEAFELFFLNDGDHKININTIFYENPMIINRLLPLLKFIHDILLPHHPMDISSSSIRDIFDTLKNFFINSKNKNIFAQAINNYITVDITKDFDLNNQKIHIMEIIKLSTDLNKFIFNKFNTKDVKNIQNDYIYDSIFFNNIFNILMNLYYKIIKHRDTNHIIKPVVQLSSIIESFKNSENLLSFIENLEETIRSIINENKKKKNIKEQIEHIQNNNIVQNLYIQFESQLNNLLPDDIKKSIELESLNRNIKNNQNNIEENSHENNQYLIINNGNNNHSMKDNILDYKKPLEKDKNNGETSIIFYVNNSIMLMIVLFIVSFIFIGMVIINQKKTLDEGINLTKKIQKFLIKQKNKIKKNINFKVKQISSIKTNNMSKTINNKI